MLVIIFQGETKKALRCRTMELRMPVPDTCSAFETYFPKPWNFPELLGKQIKKKKRKIKKKKRENQTNKKAFRYPRK